MATDKQIEANRPNPRTRCLTTEDIYVAPGDEQLFIETLEGFRAELQPVGEIEASLFNDLFHAHWSLRNARRAEAALSRDNFQDIDRLSRYQSKFERSFFKALQILGRVQTERVYLSTFDDATDAEDSPLVSWREIRQRRLAERKAGAQAEHQEIFNYLDRHPLVKTKNEADSLTLAEMKNEPVLPSVANPILERVARNEANSTQRQIPRSAPCPCGSGTKYKRCCGKDAPPVLFHQAAA